MDGSVFRYLNEIFYTKSSEQAFEFFNSSPELCGTYHKGFVEQTAKWPMDPLEDVIKFLEIKTRGKQVIADLGCGTAKIQDHFGNRRVVKSFDMMSGDNPNVIKCNLKCVPMEENSTHCAVFCLSLMGTDWPIFVAEAWRILKPMGLLKVMELTSRITNKEKVIKSFESLGFKCIYYRAHEYFVDMTFKRNKVETFRVVEVRCMRHTRMVKYHNRNLKFGLKSVLAKSTLKEVAALRGRFRMTFKRKVPLHDTKRLAAKMASTSILRAPLYKKR